MTDCELLLYSHLEGGDQGGTHGDEGHVGLGEVRGAAGAVDLGLAVEECGGEVGELRGPAVILPPPAGQT